MNDLKNTTALVKALLERDERCRNSDGFLYLNVLHTIAYQKNISLRLMTVADFLMNHYGTNFPPFETVRRARQKVQSENPNLAACKSVKEFRAENEAAYRAFARGEA